MGNDRAENKLIESMFEALLKQRFSQFAKKYGQKSVIQSWAAVIKSGGIKAFLSDREWNSDTKVVDALDCLDDYCDSVEPVIRRRIKRGRGKESLRCENIERQQQWGQNGVALMKKYGMK